jgi:hypothetical protein
MHFIQLSVDPGHVSSTTLRFRDNDELNMALNWAGVPLYPQTLCSYHSCLNMGRSLHGGHLYTTERMKILVTR